MKETVFFPSRMPLKSPGNNIGNKMHLKKKITPNMKPDLHKNVNGKKFAGRERIR